MSSDTFDGAVRVEDPDRMHQNAVPRGCQSVAGVIAMVVLFLMPFVGVVALFTYELLAGWHLLLIFPVEMLVAQFAMIDPIAFVVIGSVRTAMTVYLALISKRPGVTAALVVGVHVIVAVVAHEYIYRGGH